MALLHANIFVPDFIVHRGYVFLSDGLMDVATDFEEKGPSLTLGIDGSVESYNWRDLYGMFVDGNYDQSVYEELAHAIAEAWRARLQMLFPERQFVVEVLSPEVTGYGVGVGFVEMRKTLQR